MTAFTLTGEIGGVVTTIFWTEGEGFTDPSGKVELAVFLKTVYSLTPTGPFYRAADAPPLVAFLTALRAFDDPGAVVQEGTDAIQEEIATLIRLPEGAVG